MDKILNPLKDATRTNLSWLLSCWRLRAGVTEAVAALSHSPSQTELAELSAANEALRRAADESAAANQAKIGELEAEIVRHKNEADSLRDEIGRLKNENDILKRDILSLKDAHSAAVKDAERKHAVEMESLQSKLNDAIKSKPNITPAVKVENEMLQQKIKDLDKELQSAKDGNRALLKFVHTGHRLSSKAEPGTIRALLQHAGKKH